jgi:hypothetical protein
VHEVLRKEVVNREEKNVDLTATTVGSASCEVSPVAAGNYEKLSAPNSVQSSPGCSSRTRCTIDGTLRSYSMGTKKVGTRLQMDIP